VAPQYRPVSASAQRSTRCSVQTGLRRLSSTIPCSRAYDLGGLWTKSGLGGSL
jgi:hypothetical protein